MTRLVVGLSLLLTQATIIHGILSDLTQSAVPRLAEKKDWFVLLTRDAGAIQGECGRVQCGGALVAKDMVLTAAHCFDDVLKDPCASTRINTAWVGRQAMSCDFGDIGRPFNIESLYVDPAYDPNDENNWHDYALVKLCGCTDDNTVFASYDIDTVPAYPEVLRLFGFGRTTGLDSTTSPFLMYGITQTDPLPGDNYSCPFWSDNYDGRYQFCTLPQVACYGDSGGPLVLGDDNIVGIASFMTFPFPDTPQDDYYCSNEGGGRFGDLYTNVTFYKEKIKATICANSASPPASCRTAKIRDEDIMTARDLPMPNTINRMVWMVLTRARRFFRSNLLDILDWSW